MYTLIFSFISVHVWERGFINMLYCLSFWMQLCCVCWIDVSVPVPVPCLVMNSPTWKCGLPAAALCWSCSETAAHTWGLIFISLVFRRLLAYSFSCSASYRAWPGGNSVCVRRTCWYVLLTHACLSMSWGCGICAVEVFLRYCHVQWLTTDSVCIFAWCLIHFIHETTVKLWSADTEGKHIK